MSIIMRLNQLEDSVKEFMEDMLILAEIYWFIIFADLEEEKERANDLTILDLFDWIIHEDFDLVDALFLLVSLIYHCHYYFI